MPPRIVIAGKRLAMKLRKLLQNTVFRVSSVQNGNLLAYRLNFWNLILDSETWTLWITDSLNNGSRIANQSALLPAGALHRVLRRNLRVFFWCVSNLYLSFILLNSTCPTSLITPIDLSVFGQSKTRANYPMDFFIHMTDHNETAAIVLLNLAMWKTQTN